VVAPPRPDPETHARIVGLRPSCVIGLLHGSSRGREVRASCSASARDIDRAGGHDGHRRSESCSQRNADGIEHAERFGLASFISCGAASPRPSKSSAILLFEEPLSEAARDA